MRDKKFVITTGEQKTIVTAKSVDEAITIAANSICPNWTSIRIYRSKTTKECIGLIPGNLPIKATQVN